MNWIELLKKRYELIEGQFCELDKARITFEIRTCNVTEFQQLIAIHKPDALTLISCQDIEIDGAIAAMKLRWRCVYFALLQLRMLIQWAESVSLLTNAAQECELKLSLQPFSALVSVLSGLSPCKVAVST